MLSIVGNELSSRNPAQFDSGPQAIGEVHQLFCLFSSGSDELLQGAAGTLLALPRCQDLHTYVEDGGDTAGMWKDVPVLDTIPGFDLGAKFCGDCFTGEADT